MRNSFLATSWHSWRAALGQGERALFARLRKACRSNDPRTALSSLTAWLGCCFEESAFLSIEEFAEQFCDDDLEAQLASLREAAEELEPDWCGHGLYGAVGMVRNKLKAKLSRSYSPPLKDAT